MRLELFCSLSCCRKRHLRSKWLDKCLPCVWAKTNSSAHVPGSTPPISLPQNFLKSKNLQKVLAKEYCCVVRTRNKDLPSFWITLCFAQKLWLSLYCAEKRFQQKCGWHQLSQLILKCRTMQTEGEGETSLSRLRPICTHSARPKNYKITKQRLFSPCASNYVRALSTICQSNSTKLCICWKFSWAN